LDPIICIRALFIKFRTCSKSSHPTVRPETRTYHNHRHFLIGFYWFGAQKFPPRRARACSHLAHTCCPGTHSIWRPSFWRWLSCAAMTRFHRRCTSGGGEGSVTCIEQDHGPLISVSSIGQSPVLEAGFEVTILAQ
jgi:hypothetical protein